MIVGVIVGLIVIVIEIVKDKGNLPSCKSPICPAAGSPRWPLQGPRLALGAHGCRIDRPLLMLLM